MNLRIRELAEQCWINDGGPDSYFSKEKFAELIVKECISALDIDDGATHHSELLLEHFGVAE
jgi:hypothetical protein